MSGLAVAWEGRNRRVGESENRRRYTTAAGGEALCKAHFLEPES